MFWLKVHELPQAGRGARGKAIINLVQLAEGEKIAAILPVKDLKGRPGIDDELEEGDPSEVLPEALAGGVDATSAGLSDAASEIPAEQVDAEAGGIDPAKASEGPVPPGGPFLIFVTKKGLVKRTRLGAFARPRPSGLRALSIREDDALVTVLFGEGNEDVLINTASGIAIRFPQKEVRAMGRTAAGVKGITLEAGDAVVAAELARESATLLTVTERGYGKRSALAEYRRTHRGGKGIIDIKTSERNGPVVAVAQVTDADELMLITNKGMLIRTRIAEISIIGRNTQGVRLIDLQQEGEKVVGATRAPEDREADAAAAAAEETAGAESAAATEEAEEGGESGGETGGGEAGGDGGGDGGAA